MTRASIFSLLLYPTLRRATLTLLLLTLVCTGGRAQGFSGGFRAGLNFITQSGPVEMSPDEQINYERVNRTVGFHVGATFAYAFTDLVGVKADLLYTQRGAEFVFTDTPGYFYLYADGDDREGTLLLGNRNSEKDIVNSYIDVPVTAYYRVGKFELEGGFSAGLLINSRTSGAIVFDQVAGFPGETITFSLDGRLGDDAGAGSIIVLNDTPLSSGVFPPETIGSYYNSDKDDPLYRRLDFGLVAGLAYYFNNGLYLGGRYQYGLTDVSRPDNDLRVSVDPDNPGRTFNEDDKDYARSFQVSIGFRF